MSAKSRKAIHWGCLAENYGFCGKARKQNGHQNLHFKIKGMCCLSSQHLFFHTQNSQYFVLCLQRNAHTGNSCCPPTIASFYLPTEITRDSPTCPFARGIFVGVRKKDLTGRVSKLKAAFFIARFLLVMALLHLHAFKSSERKFTDDH